MLDSVYPSFLNLLDSDPDTAFKAFYAYTYRLLHIRSMREMRRLSDSESQDLLHEIVLHCVRDNFGILRQYADRGKPFAAWLYIVAHNKCLDYLRKKKRNRDYVSTVNHLSDPDHGIEFTNPEPSPEKRARLTAAVGIVRDCMTQLGQYCRLLLQLAADEYTPQEMVLVLGWPGDKNKKVSDDLRECRKRLRKLLGQRGVDVESTLNK